MLSVSAHKTCLNCDTVFPIFAEPKKRPSEIIEERAEQIGSDPSFNKPYMAMDAAILEYLDSQAGF